MSRPPLTWAAEDCVIGPEIGVQPLVAIAESDLSESSRLECRPAARELDRSVHLETLGPVWEQLDGWATHLQG